jgi:serine O-acetyltransferase
VEDSTVTDTTVTEPTLGELFRMDVARWLRPGEIGHPHDVTVQQAAILLYRHMGLRAVLAMRIGRWLKSNGIPGGPSFMQRLIYRRYGLDVVIRAHFGGGLYIAHPVGTTLAPASIGENCSVIASVTVGMRNNHEFPTIGDRVFLGAGAKVLGGIHLGDDVKVGANAVVIDDVEPGDSVGGIPARSLVRR